MEITKLVYSPVVLYPTPPPLLVRSVVGERERHRNVSGPGVGGLTRFVNSDPRAPLVGLRANTGARFENRDLPLALSLVRGGALGLRGLEAYS